jgi:Leucine-rich repeat (LRR) protein
VLNLTYGLSNANGIENIVRLSKFDILLETSINIDLSSEARFIEKIANKTFKNLPKIRELRLRRFKNLINDNIDLDIEDNSFNYLLNLVTMEMFNIKLKQLNTDTFIGLSNLKFLKLSCCQINDINSSLFRPLNFLVELDLSYNNIQRIDKDVFNGLTNLENLVLSNNSMLNDIELGAFDYLTNIETMDLSNCSITLSQDFLFRNLKRLREINLTYNKIQMIKTNTFMGLTNLKVLNIAYRYNCIKIIEENAFSHLVNLEALIICGSESTLNTLDGLDVLRNTEVCKKIYSY